MILTCGKERSYMGFLLECLSSCIIFADELILTDLRNTKNKQFIFLLSLFSFLIFLSFTSFLIFLTFVVVTILVNHFNALFTLIVLFFFICDCFFVYKVFIYLCGVIDNIKIISKKIE